MSYHVFFQKFPATKSVANVPLFFYCHQILLKYWMVTITVPLEQVFKTDNGNSISSRSRTTRKLFAPKTPVKMSPQKLSKQNRVYPKCQFALPSSPNSRKSCFHLFFVEYDRCFWVARSSVIAPNLGTETLHNISTQMVKVTVTMALLLYLSTKIQLTGPPYWIVKKMSLKCC